MNCDCPNCTSWWKSYLSTPADRRRTFKEALKAVAVIVLLAVTYIILVWMEG